jgi:DNA-binding beta-propeller fold protein YncE
MLNSCNLEVYFLVGPKTGIPTVVHSVSTNDKVCALALLDSQLFVTRYRIARISVYDKTTLKLKGQLSFHGLGTVLWGLATCTVNNSLYVSDLNYNCVHRVDVTGSIVIAKWNVARGPRGLSVNRACNVLVASWDSKIFQEYTPSGSLLREISDRNQLWQAVELDDRELVISRCGPEHGIATITVDGQVMQIFGKQPGSRNGQMNSPRCVVVDKRGYFLVAEYINSRVTVVNPSLTDARTLPLTVDSPLQYACALCLDESRGRLYVGEHGGQNRLLVFDNVLCD